MITFQLLADMHNKMTVAWYLDSEIIQITTGDLKEMEQLILEVMN